MPTVLRIGPYKFYFCSHEPNEPSHVHVDRDAQSAKIWLEPVSLACNFGFNAYELREILSLVSEHQQQLIDSWNGYFGNTGR